nr:SDR family oxidoreductase [uncultured Cohaesibacter sp.]
MIAVTGASGHLGRLVIKALLNKINASEIIALVRNPDAVSDLAAAGVVVRKADYDQPESYVEALKGVDKLMMISGSAVGQRVAQHTAVIEAAKANNVKFIAYTSLLKAAKSPMLLAEEHVATEALLNTSGIPHALLRNGWYSENYTENLAPTLETGAVIGASGEGRVASASRADYAEAAAVVMTSAIEEQAGKIYELAGDEAFTMSAFALKVASATGKKIAYIDMSKQDYIAALTGAGVPEGFAEILGDSSDNVKGGWLEDSSKILSALIGRPTTPIDESIKAAL